MAQILGPCSPRLDDPPRRFQQTAPPTTPGPLSHFVLYLDLPSSRQESENCPLKPCSLRPLVLFSSLSGCCFLGRRVESNGTGLQISLKNVLGRLAVATVKAVALPWCWEGQVGL